MSSYKTCNACGTMWKDRSDFLSANDVTYIGYQDFVEEGILGLFLFNHVSCGTTLALEAKRLRDLHGGDMVAGEQHSPDNPPPSCLAHRNGASCPPACECSYVHELSLKLSGEWPAAE